MAVKKKKGQAGEAVRYISRNLAIKKLQLSLSEFYRLCIYKGIYPREPKSRKKAQKGNTQIKTLYLKDDITFLQHEQLIWAIRNENIHKRKLKTVKGKKERSQEHYLSVYQKPTYKLDHIVLERYPTFDRALQDLDDPLSTCFLYAVLPADKDVESDMINLCRRLTVEFMHYVIEAKALRKAFISVKGYYYRAHIQGEKITWTVPHAFTPENRGKVSLTMMSRFVELYATLLGFVNFKLYQSLNLRYPPKLATKVGKKANISKEDVYASLLESLSIPLGKHFVDVNDDPDDGYDRDLFFAHDKKLKLAEEEQERAKKQVQLFKDIKFYVGRETNRESLTFVIRSAGGLVSFDATLGSGATYGEADKDIMYQIVDRPQVEKKYLSRYYVQPQWVYDSFNNGILMPVQNYFPGVELPAHLSPFEESIRKNYLPPEKHRLNALTNKVELIGDKSLVDMDKDFSSEDEDEEIDECDVEESQPEVPQDETNLTKETEDKTQKKRKRAKVNNKKTVKGNEETGENDNKETGEDDNKETEERDAKKTKTAAKKTKTAKKEAHRIERADTEEKTDNNAEENEVTEPQQEKSQDLLAQMQVKSGKPERKNEKLEKEQWEREDFRLASSFIHRKQRRLFKKILKKEREREKRGLDLKRKRILYEEEMLKRRKTNKSKTTIGNTASVAVAK